ncbi:hypothetical protein [Stenotrophomonas oahuensis]|uniref:Uncharacterized protein n=1 Tax=Stenotrophomonas oahuensis TaxID=3003271 RepID=A0ABY9YKP4_9GAMM|nr:hypothetical protein [Stenotrophomonas sp. A5586]WNH50834.1 hypothetical protein PDM29_10535 [Stenotrophomonas sp. A5586]
MPAFPSLSALSLESQNPYLNLAAPAPTLQLHVTGGDAPRNLEPRCISNREANLGSRAIRVGAAAITSDATLELHLAAVRDGTDFALISLENDFPPGSYEFETLGAAARRAAADAVRLDALSCPQAALKFHIPPATDDYNMLMLIAAKEVGRKQVIDGKNVLTVKRELGIDSDSEAHNVLRRAKGERPR